LIKAIGAAGGSVQGIVVWEAPDPAIPFLSEVPERTSILPRYAAMRRAEGSPDAETTEPQQDAVTRQD
jgi:hypothetical protein